ncbi:hypothetical protein [Candidatus Lokiarchaeum ossiferum]|uniref:hypothetical protein n=1 Tax=Candidatus Lokiarchaeum ossiferum TaxID=2951803 RepID=UPI00352FC309
MSKGKIFGISTLMYLLLNLLFIVLYGIVGLHNGFGEFFGLIGDDISGFLTALLTPGGIVGDVFGGTHHYIILISTPGSMSQGIIGLCWVILPGFLTALTAGIKLSHESSKNAFTGVFFMVLIFTSLPLILAAVWSPNAASVMTTEMVPIMYQDIVGVMQYLYPPLVGLFNALFFGGIAAASASSL